MWEKEDVASEAKGRVRTGYMICRAQYKMKI